MGIESWFHLGHPEGGAKKPKNRSEPPPGSLDSYSLVDKAVDESGKIKEPESRTVATKSRPKSEDRAEGKKAA